MSTEKNARPPTRRRVGTVKKHGDTWKVRVTMGDGKKSPWFYLDPGTTEEQAHEVAGFLAAEAAAGRLVKKPPAFERPHVPGETLRAWSDRWFEARKVRGLDTYADRGRFRKWVLDPAFLPGERALGDLAFAGVTRADVETLVEFLDGKVRDGAIAWKTAVNVWGLVTKACADAVNAKDRALRILGANPTTDVRGPDRGTDKAKAWLHPKDVALAIGDEDEPLELRRALALSVYLYPRPGELRALTCEDVDLETMRVSIHRTEARDGTTKPTKTKHTRRVPIEPALVPLLAAISVETDGKGKLAPGMPEDTVLADELRALLERVGVKRAELFASDATRRRLRWYDLRATGVTWRAIRGDEPLRIMQNAGHERFETTMRYVREAEDVGGDLGPVFASLPPEIYERRPERSDTSDKRRARNLGKPRVGRQGLEPHQGVGETGNSGDSRMGADVSPTGTSEFSSLTADVPDNVSGPIAAGLAALRDHAAAEMTAAVLATG